MSVITTAIITTLVLSVTTGLIVAFIRFSVYSIIFGGISFYARILIVTSILSIIAGMLLIFEYKYMWITQLLQYVGLEQFESGSGEVDMAPLGTDDPSQLSPGAALSQSTEKLLSDFVPVQSEQTAEDAWAKIPSQTCLATDQGEKLKPSRSYYQRTNNYKRTHPDDCSAPFHEMLGTFYAPTLGAGATIPTGLPLPGGLVECNGPALTPKGWGHVGSIDLPE
jgi:hypothetical protein